MLEGRGLETRVFGSGISLFLVVLYLEVRDLSRKTEALEQQLRNHLGCIGVSEEVNETQTVEKPGPVKESISSHSAAAAVLMSIGGW